MVLKTSAPLSSTLFPPARNPQRNEFFKPIQKNILSIRYAVTALAVYVQFIFKTLDFYNVIISDTFVKLAYLATIKLKTLFFYFLTFCRKTIFQLIDC